jgi:homoserine kinase
MGLALAEPADVVEARWAEGTEVVLEDVTGIGARALPRDSRRNCAAVAAREALRLAGEKRGVRLRLRKGLPAGSGMGSSSASSAAGAVAVDRLLGAGLSDSELLRAALRGERAASGAEHPDNVAPALFGGLVLVRSLEPLDLVRVAVPARAWFAVARPHRVVRTEDARRVLPARVPLEAAVDNCRNAAALLLAAERGDLSLWGRATRDRLAEPARRNLLPGLEEARAAALEAGALGHGISGSGPALFALCPSRRAAVKSAGAMARVYRRRGVGCDTLVTRADNRGAVGRRGRKRA